MRQEAMAFNLNDRDLFSFGDFIRPIVIIGTNGIEVINLFKLRSDILHQVIGFPALGSGIANKNDRFIGRKGIGLLLQVINGQIDRRLKVPGLILLGAAHIDQKDALGIFR